MKAKLLRLYRIAGMILAIPCEVALFLSYQGFISLPWRIMAMAGQTSRLAVLILAGVIINSILWSIYDRIEEAAITYWRARQLNKVFQR